MIIDPGDILFGKYRVLRLLGSGAFADVYLVQHEQLRVQRALKVLRRDKPGVGSTVYSDTARRFRLEAQLGARHVDHPNLVSVYGMEESSSALALEMEHAAGGSLQQRLDRQGQGLAKPLDVTSVVRMLREIATALKALHAQDVVHRDVKPSNILFHGDGRAMLADLGLAQVRGQSSSRGGSMGDSMDGEAPRHPGTPPYMSPEARLQNLHLAPSSDVYGLGVVAYEALTGRQLPNVRPTERWFLLPAATPGWLRDLLRAMVDESPDGRPWDGAELLERIEAGLGRGQWIDGLRKAPGSRGVWGRSSWRAMVAAGGLVALGLVLGLAKDAIVGPSPGGSTPSPTATTTATATVTDPLPEATDTPVTATDPPPEPTNLPATATDPPLNPTVPIATATSMPPVKTATQTATAEVDAVSSPATTGSLDGGIWSGSLVGNGMMEFVRFATTDDFVVLHLHQTAGARCLNDDEFGVRIFLAGTQNRSVQADASGCRKELLMLLPPGLHTAEMANWSDITVNYELWIEGGEFVTPTP